MPNPKITFHPGTIIKSSEFNNNFKLIYNKRIVIPLSLVGITPSSNTYSLSAGEMDSIRALLPLDETTGLQITDITEGLILSDIIDVIDNATGLVLRDPFPDDPAAKLIYGQITTLTTGSVIISFFKDPDSPAPFTLNTSANLTIPVRSAFHALPEDFLRKEFVNTFETSVGLEDDIDRLFDNTGVSRSSIDSPSLKVDFENHRDASSGVHGVIGNVVGTSDSQTLTNKTISFGLNTLTDVVSTNTIQTISAKKTFTTGTLEATNIKPTTAGTLGHIIPAVTDDTIALLVASQTLTNKSLGSGTVLTDDLNANTNKIINLAEPIDPQDAATKNYVDTATPTPGGADTQIQFNDSGSFNGSSDFIWNKVDGILTIGTESPTDSYVKITRDGYYFSQQADSGTPLGFVTLQRHHIGVYGFAGEFADINFLSDNTNTCQIKFDIDNILYIGNDTTITQFNGGISLPDQKPINFYEQVANGNNYLSIEAPDSLSGISTWKLPDGNGSSGYVLSTDGSNPANLSWVPITAATGTPNDTFTINDDGNGVILSSSGQTGTHTFTFPDIDQLLVGETSTQTLTNKTLGSNTVLGANLDAANTYKIVGLIDPTQAQDAATKAYVDAVVSSLDLKKSVRVATTTNITLAGAQTIDGVSLSAGDRVLVKDQTTGSQNGIYDVVDPGAWIRSADSDNSPSGGEVTSGMFTFVEEGTVNGDNGWVLTTNDPIVLDTTSLTFTQFSGAGQIIAGAGLTKTGNQLDVIGTTNRIDVFSDNVDIASTYVGQTSITTLGTITTGTWNGSTIALNKGGTNATAFTALEIVRANAGGTALESSGKVVPSGAIVGTTDTQTLTNKTIAFGSNTLTDVVSISTAQTITGAKSFEKGVRDDSVQTTTSVVEISNPANGGVFQSGAPPLGDTGTKSGIIFTRSTGGKRLGFIGVSQTSNNVGDMIISLGNSSLDPALTTFLTFVNLDTSGGRAIRVASTIPLQVESKISSFANSFIDFDSKVLSNLADPLAAQDAATKNYVDTYSVVFAKDILVVSNIVTDHTIPLSHTPKSNSEVLSWNGIVLVPGALNDYTISGSTVTIAAGITLTIGDRFLITYAY